MGSCKYTIDANGDADLGFCDDGSKAIGKGIYVPQLLFNAELPGNWDVNAHRRLMSDETRESYDKELSRFDPLSEEQRNFSSECLAPTNAIAMGQGPAGSGKTTIIVAIAQSALKAGFKVLVCTKTEGAKEQLIKRWKDSSDPLVHKDQWCNKHLLDQSTKLVFSTLNESGHETLVESFRPDMIIISECGAALTTEMAIPIVAYQDHIKSVVLLGDHKQLAPRFVSGYRNSAAREMGSTIFDRYAEGQGSSAARPDLQPYVFFCNVQHRSHPEIMAWSSETVYGDRIEHGPSTTTPTDISRTIEEFFARTHEYFKRDAIPAVEAVQAQKAKGDQPAVEAVKAAKAIPGREGQCYRMGVNVSSTSSGATGTGTSMRNEGEIRFITWLVNELLSYRPTGPGTRRIVASDLLVETGYRSQVKGMQESLKNVSLHPGCRHVEVRTIFGMQGHEANIVLFSFVQNNDTGHDVGFMRDGRNLNVASTRAKKLSVTVGNFELFLQSIANQEMLQYNMRKFCSFVEHFQDRNDITIDEELVNALKSTNPTVLVRDESAWPRQFTKSDEARAEQDVVED